jgi:hypothetical protein
MLNNVGGVPGGFKVPVEVRSVHEDNIAVFDAANGLQSAMRAAFCRSPYVERELTVKEVAKKLVMHIPYFHPVRRPAQCRININSNISKRSSAGSSVVYTVAERGPE